VWRASSLGAKLPKEPGGGAEGMAEDAEDVPVGPNCEAFHRLLADRGGGEAPALDLAEMLVTMLGHNGKSYSQAIAELGFQLMAMRLTTEQALTVTRAFECNF
jgi:hypothetical protein